MPDIQRLPIRMNVGTGLDLVHPLDRMPDGSFPYLLNARVVEEGRIDGRPGYSSIMQLSDPPNSVRRLNDPSLVYSPAGYIYVGGGGTKLYAGTESAYAVVDTGYSGNPLSLIPFKPDSAPESWMYVYDSRKMVKVSPAGVIRGIGVAPPTTAPGVEYGVPATVDITTGQATAGWAATGIDTGPTLGDRTNTSAPTISSILYNSGTTGWCCIYPVLTQPFWVGNRMKVILNAGGGNAETVVVRETHSAISTTTVASILYDSGVTGKCSIVLTGSPVGLSRNSLIQIGTEIVRVLEVNLSPDGSAYSIRCSTVSTHAALDAVTGMVSWYVYTALQHVATESITSSYLAFSHSASGVGGGTKALTLDAAVAGGRPIDPANDYLHIGVFLQNPLNVTTLQVLINLDLVPNYSFSTPGNSYVFTLSQADLGSGDDSWVDIVVPISSATRTGNDLTKTLATVTGVAVQMTTTGACAWGIDWLYLFGTYGPTVQPNSPVGLQFQSRFRDFTTGAKSVPGPLTRAQMFPLRESVIITPQTTTVAGVDTIDIYGMGGTISSPLFLSSVVNTPSSPVSYTDTLPDTVILETNQPPDLTVLQPWPTLYPPMTGTGTVSGTTVVVTGFTLPANLVGNTAVFINGAVFLTHGQPRSPNTLELILDAGSLVGATISIPSPTVAATCLPFAFGALEGPFAPVVFALGDPNNGGTLYYSNFSDADSSSDVNTLDITTPSDSLVSGAIWQGMAFAGNRDTIICIRFSYLTTIGASNSPAFQWTKVSTPSGMWSRWSCCNFPLGVAYLGRDGLYVATDSGGVNITDANLYPLFPHDGQPAKSVVRGRHIIYPVDMTALTSLRLTYCDESLRFSYKDTNGTYNTLMFEIYKKRWILNIYASEIGMHYLVEAQDSSPNRQEILMLGIDSNNIKLSGGDTDDQADIQTVVLTPSMDGGDQRSQKLYVDSMTQAGGTGVIILDSTYDNAQSYSPDLSIDTVGSIQQYLQNIASLADLSLHKNIGAEFSWVGGPDGPTLYAWEISGYLQPYLSAFFVTQFISFSFPGWKHMRRSFPAIISNDPVLMTIKCQDGRTYGPYTIPSTGGQFRVLPQMLDCGIKDLAFAIQLDGGGNLFALFPQDFTLEVKQWNEESYINLAVFKS